MEPSVVEVVVVDTRVECSSVVGSVAPSGPVVPVSTEVAHFMRVLSGAEPLATLQVVAHVERPDLPHPSIVIQIDMLVWHLFKLRLNRDYCALLYNESFCPVYGPLPWGSPLSTVFCLFVPRSLGELPGLIESVQSECGWGVFVTPVHRGGRVLTFSGESAFETLVSFSKQYLSFSFKGPNPRGSLFKLVPWRAFVVSFRPMGFGPKRKPGRSELSYSLTSFPGAEWPTKVGDRPFGPARVSSAPTIPSSKTDTCPASTPSPMSTVFEKPVYVSRWNVEGFSALTAAYPFPEVLTFARQTVSHEGLPSSFVGQREKEVFVENYVTEEEPVQILYDLIMKDVRNGLQAGPFPCNPFPNAWAPLDPGAARHLSRTAPQTLVPKDPWDPTSKRFRPITDQSHYKESSPNGLTASPRLVYISTQPADLRNALVLLGQGAQADLTDVESAFRMDRLCVEDLHLFTSFIKGSWFVNLFHPFGFVPSEWGFGTVTAVLSWCLSLPTAGIVPNRDDSFFFSYVDNYGLFSRRDDLTHSSRFSNIYFLLEGLKLKLHERQSGTSFNALGWDWDTEAQTFSCPLEKYLVIRDLLLGWSDRAARDLPLSSKSLERLVGFFWWVLAACPEYTPLVYVLNTVSSAAREARPVVLDQRAVFSLLSLTKFWVGWDRSRKLFHGFSPTHPHQSLVRLDASTEVGCGAWVVREGGPFFSHQWTREEQVALLQAVDPKEKLSKRSSTLGELRTLEFALVAFGSSLHGERVQFEFDSSAAVSALSKGWSPKPLCLGVIQRCLALLSRYLIIPRYEWVRRDRNRVADAASNSDFTQVHALAEELHGVRLSQVQSPSLPDPQAVDLQALKDSFLL